MLGGAAVWIYIFAAVSYALSLLGFVHYEAPGKPEDLIYKLTDAYAWYFLDLLPGLNITSALGWKAGWSSREASAERSSCSSGPR